MVVLGTGRPLTCPEFNMDLQSTKPFLWERSRYHKIFVRDRATELEIREQIPTISVNVAPQRISG